MNYLLFVNVIYRRDHVIKNASAVTLLDRRIDLDHEVAHVAQHQVHDDVDELVILVEVIELGDARMVQLFHYFLFSVNRL